MQLNEVQKFMLKFEDMACLVSSHCTKDLYNIFCDYYVSHNELQLFSGDAHHITQPQNDGRGAILAMERALEQVQILLICNSCVAHLTSFQDL
jgi:hypothetical protein